MKENEHRRQAKRQARGVLRAEEIARVAGGLFAAHGYDKVTMSMIAQQANATPGTLYQFFPYKEAVAVAFVTLAARDLQDMYDNLLRESERLPFPQFLDRLLDDLIVINQAYPGYFALEINADTSDTVKQLLHESQQAIQRRLDALLAPYWPGSDDQQRSLPLLVSYRIFLALLPLIIQGESEGQSAVIQELKRVLTTYWGAILPE